MMNTVEKHILQNHDVSDLVGLRAVVQDAAVQIVDADGDISVEVPDLGTLTATVAVARCLTPVRLRGHELRAMRRIAGLTAQDMAEKMGEKTSAETLSRWENEKQPMGGYAEKVFRLVVCDELRARARGVAYHDGAIARLVVVDPWRADSTFEMPPIVVSRVKMRSEDDRSIIDAWTGYAEAA